MMLDRPLTPLARFHAALVALNPPPRDPGEAKLRHGWDDSQAGGVDEGGALDPCRFEVVADGAKARPAAGHEADRVFAVGLLVDALLECAWRGVAARPCLLRSEKEEDCTRRPWQRPGPLRIDAARARSITSGRPSYPVLMTTRQKAEQLLRTMPDEQVPVALEALEAVERYAQTLKVLRTRDPQKSERELMESLVRIKEGDDAIEQIGARFAGVDPDELEREAVKAVGEVRAERASGSA